MASRLSLALRNLPFARHASPLTSGPRLQGFQPSRTLRSSTAQRGIQTLPARTGGHARPRISVPRSRGQRSVQRRPFSHPAPPPPPAPPAPPSLSARLRQLSREYGYSAVGIYFGLSALDFPFCFLAVQALGTERIGRFEHAVLDRVKASIGAVVPSLGEKWEAERRARLEAEANPPEVVEQVVEGNGNGNGEASLGTRLAIAYAIHKSFIFLRVPLTAAITPKVVKTLRSWGWNIGKKPKA